MEFGVGTLMYELAGIPLAESVDRINKFGVKYLDIITYSVYNPTLLSVDTQNAIGAKMREYGMRASSVIACPSFNLATNDPDEREQSLEYLKRSCLFVKRMGGKQITLGAGAGNVDYDLPRSEAMRNSASLIKELCKWAQKEDIYISLELEPEGLYVLTSIDSMKEMIDLVQEENCCANIDVGHFHILREKPEKLDIIKDRIVHMHLSDNNGFSHTNSVPGTGNINFEWFVETAYNLGIDKNCERFGDVAVAAIEIGEPGHYITDPDNQALISIGEILSRIPLLRDKALAV